MIHLLTTLPSGPTVVTPCCDPAPALMLSLQEEEKESPSKREEEPPRWRRRWRPEEW